eukprot:3219185-Alexandrium_andersonii.AAC.1
MQVSFVGAGPSRLWADGVSRPNRCERGILGGGRSGRTDFKHLYMAGCSGTAARVQAFDVAARGQHGLGCGVLCSWRGREPCAQA